TSATHGPVHLVEVDGVAHRVSRDEGGVVRSPAPALVVATPLAVDDEVEAGAPLLRLEPVSDAGTGAADAASAAGPPVRQTGEIDLPAVPADVPAAKRAERCLADLRGLLLGYDDDTASPRRVLTGYLTARAELGGTPLPGEVELLTVFADMSELSRNQPDGS